MEPEERTVTETQEEARERWMIDRVLQLASVDPNDRSALRRILQHAYEAARAKAP